MSMFAYGIILPKSWDADLLELARLIAKSNEQTPYKFNLLFGGNATSYWCYMKDMMEEGLPFEITNSLIENTVEEIFYPFPTIVEWGTRYAGTKGKHRTGDAENFPFEERLAYTQQLIQFMLSLEQVESVRLCIVEDPGPITPDQFECCYSDAVAEKIASYYDKNMLCSDVFLLVQKR